VRQYAAGALGRIGEPSSRDTLDALANDMRERDYVRTTARVALRRLGSKGGVGSGRVPQQRTNEATVGQGADIVAFLQHPSAPLIKGPWDAGYALAFHSRFEGQEWHRTPLGELAYRLKYESDATALAPLVEEALLVCRSHPELAQVDAIIRVPSTTERRFDALDEFSTALARRLSLPLWPLLSKVRATQPQKEMTSLAQKQANVAGAFAVGLTVRDKALLVLDDLFDSGATLTEVCRLLRRAGARRIHVLTLTRTIHTDA
jgi:hypothetical protein